MSTDENQLRIQIEQHKNQLQFINEQYQHNPDDDLLSLKCNLEELVHLLSEELTSIEKKKLVNPPSNNILADNQNDDENDEAIERLEFSVPYRLQNGQIEYHDAIITFADDDEHVKAFFVYPIESSMLTCPYFLQNNCYYDNCKYSHGFQISIDQLAPKLALDFSNEDNLNKLKDKSIKYCLVENEKPFKNTGQFLWSAGVLVDFKSCDQVLVRFLNANEEWINADRLIILNDLPSQKTKLTDNDFQSICFTDHQVSIQVHDQFGAWEKYTNGIGSKLLAKMGYEIGKGLGKQADGIINPIQPIIYPTGKSLDNCFFLKQEHDKKKNEWKEIIKERKKLSKFENQLSKLSGNNKWKRNSIFQLLNTKVINSHQSKKKEEFVKKKDYFKKMNTQTLNITLFKVEQNLQNAQLELKRMENCFKDRYNHTSTSSCHDRTILNDFHRRIDKQRNLVSSLQQQHSTVSKEVKTRIQQNKLTNF